jgi:hypothetical protein
MKVKEVVERALRRIGYQSAGDDLPPDDARDGAAILSSMMAGWPRRGLSGYTHAALTMDSDFPLTEEHHEGVIAMLALRLTDDFAPEADTPTLRKDAALGWSILCSAFMTVPVSSFDLPRKYRSET